MTRRNALLAIPFRTVVSGLGRLVSLSRFGRDFRPWAFLRRLRRIPGIYVVE